LLTEDEWAFLSRNYDFDKVITVVKIAKESTELASKQKDGSPTPIQSNSQSAFYYLFEPEVCQKCIRMNELTKFIFENKKIFIRQIDEDNPTTVPTFTNNTNASDIQPVSANLNNEANNEELETFSAVNVAFKIFFFKIATFKELYEILI
jgi:NDP-sugar pyrophosphorylase family protein